MSQPPDAEKFADVLLWHVAGLRADLADLHARVADLSSRLQAQPDPETDARWKKKTKEQRDQIYLEAMKVVGLKAQPPSPPTPGLSSPEPPSNGGA